MAWTVLQNSTTNDADEVMGNFAFLQGDIAPFDTNGTVTTNAFNLGTSSALWKGVYASSISTQNIVMSGTLSFPTNNISDGAITGNWYISGNLQVGDTVIGSSNLNVKGNSSNGVVEITRTGAGSSNYRALVLDSEDASNYAGIAFNTLGTERGYIYQQADGTMFYNANNDHIFRNNGANTMYTDINKRVGINGSGTANARLTLHETGNGTNTLFRLIGVNGAGTTQTADITLNVTQGTLDLPTLTSLSVNGISKFGQIYAEAQHLLGTTTLSSGGGAINLRFSSTTDDFGVYAASTATLPMRFNLLTQGIYHAMCSAKVTVQTSTASGSDPTLVGLRITQENFSARPIDELRIGVGSSSTYVLQHSTYFNVQSNSSWISPQIDVYGLGGSNIQIDEVRFVMYQLS